MKDKDLKRDEREYCVICGAETPYKTNDHIVMREFFVSGVGQLCKECGLKYKIERRR